LKPPKRVRVKPESAGASSLMKKPRYLTFGVPAEYAPGSTYSAACFCGGTSAHQYQGDTPICSDRS
jgi:hypothetical protein